MTLPETLLPSGATTPGPSGNGNAAVRTWTAPWAMHAQERLEWVRAQAQQAVILRKGRFESNGSVTFQDEDKGLELVYDELNARLETAQTFLDQSSHGSGAIRSWHWRTGYEAVGSKAHGPTSTRPRPTWWS